MRRFLYWAGALILVVALLVGIGGLASFIVEKRWPFYRIWGGAMTLAGLAFILAGRLFPAKLWGVSGAKIPEDSPALKRAARIAFVFGSLMVAGGLAFALTSKVWFLIAAFIVSASYMRLASAAS